MSGKPLVEHILEAKFKQIFVFVWNQGLDKYQILLSRRRTQTTNANKENSRVQPKCTVKEFDHMHSKTWRIYFLGVAYTV